MAVLIVAGLVWYVAVCEGRTSGVLPRSDVGRGTVYKERTIRKGEGDDEDGRVRKYEELPGLLEDVNRYAGCKAGPGNQTTQESNRWKSSSLRVDCITS